MSRITILPEELSLLIAAEQVITSVCSIVKELIENSLDAESTMICIALEGSRFGVSSVSVEDNGKGIPASFFQKVGVRSNSTKSKSSGKLGYRGEAISFISNSCKLTITSSDNSEIGRSITINRGQRGEVKQLKFGQGTLVLAEEIFSYNEVRKEGLNIEADIASVIDLVWKLSTKFYSIQFKVEKNGVEVFRNSPLDEEEGETQEEYLKQLVEQKCNTVLRKQQYKLVDYELESVATKAKVFFTSPSLNLKTKECIFYYNDRLFKSSNLSKSIRIAYLEAAKRLETSINSYMVILFLETEDKTAVETDTCAKKENIMLFHDKYLGGFLQQKLGSEIEKLCKVKYHLDEPVLGKRVDHSQELIKSKMNTLADFMAKSQPRMIDIDLEDESAQGLVPNPFYEIIGKSIADNLAPFAKSSKASLEGLEYMGYNGDAEILVYETSTSTLFILPFSTHLQQYIIQLLCCPRLIRRSSLPSSCWNSPLPSLSELLGLSSRMVPEVLELVPLSLYSSLVSSALSVASPCLPSLLHSIAKLFVVALAAAAPNEQQRVCREAFEMGRRGDVVFQATSVPQQHAQKGKLNGSRIVWRGEHDAKGKRCRGW